MMIVKKLLAKESLARAKKRIKRNLRKSAKLMILQNIFYDGHNGYLRQGDIYGK